jgi:heat-inducible transcriptional repressor
MANASFPELPNERARQVLRILVQKYIRDGQPVGSRILARESELDLSPASIRNVMADLEDLGFIASPHTSAGRVPTDKGYRFFVDMLLKLQPPHAAEVRRIEEVLRRYDSDPQGLVTEASNLLSAVTRLAGVVTVPKQPQAALRQIEFMPLSEHRVLAILVVNEREVQNRILHLHRAFSADELKTAANYLNDKFAGRDLTSVRKVLVEDLHRTRETVNEMMRHAIDMARMAFEEPSRPRPEYIIAGQTNLMDFRELSDVDKLRRLFEAFNRQRDMLHILDQCLYADGVQLFIGKESGYAVLDECSVVTAPYSVDDDVVGVLGVIGPTRMAYDRVIPIVDITARLLSLALNPRD